MQRSSVKTMTAERAMPSRSSGAWRKPFSSSLMTSGSPPTRDAITGTSQAIASSAARPKLSCADGSRNTSEMESSGTTWSCSPTKLDVVGDAQRPRRAAPPRPCPGHHRPSAGGRGTRGGCGRTRPPTAATRFTGRKFDTWITIFSSGARSGCGDPARRSGDARSSRGNWG